MPILRKIAKGLLPANSYRRSAAKLVARKLGIVSPVYVHARYQQWIAAAEPLYWEPIKDLQYRPLVSVVVPVFNPPENHLLETVFSVVNQTYDNWELILLNASSDERSRSYTRRCAEIDERIKVVDVENLGIGQNTNKGIEVSGGEYVALLDHDDTLASQALYEVVCKLQGKARPDFIYSDEDKLTANSKFRYDPHLKPDWSKYLFRQVNYLNHLTVFKKSLAETVGGYRKNFEGAQDYDFYLRIVDKNPIICHIPKILYHWRAAKTSTASDFSVKRNVLDAGIRALQEHLERNGLTGVVSALDDQPGYYLVDYATAKQQSPALVLMPGESADQYAEYVRYVVAKIAELDETVRIYTCNLGANQKYLAAHTENVTNIKADSPTKYLEQVYKDSSSESFVILNAAVSWTDGAWLRKLGGFVEQCTDIGMVSPLLVNKLADNIVDAGYVESTAGLVPLFQGLPLDAHTTFGSTVWTRSVDVLSCRVVAMSRASLKSYYMDAKASSDVACGKVLADNKELIVNPEVMLHHIGDFSLQRGKTANFSPLLTPVYTLFDFQTVSFLPPTGGDNA